MKITLVTNTHIQSDIIMAIIVAIRPRLMVSWSRVTKVTCPLLFVSLRTTGSGMMSLMTFAVILLLQEIRVIVIMKSLVRIKKLLNKRKGGLKISFFLYSYTVSKYELTAWTIESASLARYDDF